MGNLLHNAPRSSRPTPKKYENGRKVLPVFELIVVVVQGIAGPDGKYRRRVPESVIDAYLKAAREAKALLLLNVQPGHSDFMTEVKLFERFLASPMWASRSTPSGP